jgi:hypothetical protein
MSPMIVGKDATVGFEISDAQPNLAFLEAGFHESNCKQENTNCAALSECPTACHASPCSSNGPTTIDLPILQAAPGTGWNVSQIKKTFS